MTRREKLILLVMACAVLYGAYELLLKPAAGTSAPAAAVKGALEQRVAKLTQGMAAALPSPSDARVVALAAAPWARDPFFDGKLPSEIAEEKARLAAAEEARAKREAARRREDRDRERAAQAWRLALNEKIAYTGYVVMNGERFAIVNDAERRVGDELEVDDCSLDRILEDRVVVKSPTRKTTVEIMLEE